MFLFCFGFGVPELCFDIFCLLCFAFLNKNAFQNNNDRYGNPSEDVCIHIGSIFDHFHPLSPSAQTRVQPKRPWARHSLTETCTVSQVDARKESGSRSCRRFVSDELSVPEVHRVD